MARAVAKTALRELGSRGGAMLPIPGGAQLGAQAADYISKIIGFGDYNVEGNTLMTNGQVPKFGAAADKVIIKHCEYLGDVIGSTAFSIEKFPLNPGNPKTFPWLSALAMQFENYRIKGMIFMFKSTSADALNSTNTALGTVVAATQYNVLRPDFASKLEMENYEFATSSKPADSMIHPIECKSGLAPLEELYIRTSDYSSLDSDLRFSDYGNFYLATVGMQASATIGELWVSYDIELIKPRLTPSGFNNSLHSRISNNGYTNASPYGVILRGYGGNFPLEVTGSGTYDTLRFPDWITNGRFLILTIWTGSSLSITVPTYVYSNCAVGTSGWGFNADTVWSSTSGGTSTQCRSALVVDITGPNATIQATGATLPSSGTNVSVFVFQGPSPDEWPISLSLELMLEEAEDYMANPRNGGRPKALPSIVRRETVVARPRRR